MESIDAERQLNDIEALQARTIGESLRARRWSLPVLAAATVLYFGSYELESGWVPIVAPIVWVAFVIAWVRWMRSGNRAAAPRLSESPQLKHNVLLWVGLFVVANLVALLGARVSWLLAGVLMAGLGAAAGLLLRHLARA